MRKGGRQAGRLAARQLQVSFSRAPLRVIFSICKKALAICIIRTLVSTAPLSIKLVRMRSAASVGPNRMISWPCYRRRAANQGTKERKLYCTRELLRPINKQPVTPLIRAANLRTCFSSRFFL